MYMSNIAVHFKNNGSYYKIMIYSLKNTKSNLYCIQNVYNFSFIIMIGIYFTINM